MNAPRTSQARERSDEPQLVGHHYRSEPFRRTGWRRAGAASLAGLVLGGLLLVSLRMAIVRTRYALADAVATETALLDRQRRASVELRGLRDPRRLVGLAEARGFGRPERVVELGTEPVTP